MNKELAGKKSSKEKNPLEITSEFNAGIENVDFEILQLLHKCKTTREIFDLIYIDASSKIDLTA